MTKTKILRIGFNNTIIKAPNTTINFKPVRMGSYEQPICIAENVEFDSNEFVGVDFGIDATSQHHSYTVSWTLKVNIGDADSEIKILDKNGQEVINQKVEENGIVSIELPEYRVDGKEKVYYSPYTIMVGEKKEVVELRNNRTVNL